MSFGGRSGGARCATTAARSAVAVEHGRGAAELTFRVDIAESRSCRSASSDEKPRYERGFRKERMMGLEPTTFCMASVSSVRARSRQFTESRHLQVILGRDRTGANPNEPRA